MRADTDWVPKKGPFPPARPDFPPRRPSVFDAVLPKQPVQQPTAAAPAAKQVPGSRDPSWYTSPQETFKEGVRTAPGRRPFKQLLDETGASKQFEQATKGARVEAKPDPNPQRQAAADQWNKAFRRQLTDQEWGTLTDTEKQQVKFNTDLVRAYDADMTSEHPEQRQETRNLLSTLGLDAGTEKKITSGLGRTLGPALHEADLFASGGAPVDRAALTDRDKLVASIKAKLGNYATAKTASQTKADDAATSEALKNITFKSDQSKADYEASISYLMDPANISTERWSSVKKELESAGYNAEDFKNYAVNLVSLGQPGAGQTTADELKSWFAST